MSDCVFGSNRNVLSFYSVFFIQSFCSIFYSFHEAFVIFTTVYSVWHKAKIPELQIRIEIATVMICKTRFLSSCPRRITHSSSNFEILKSHFRYSTFKLLPLCTFRMWTIMAFPNVLSSAADANLHECDSLCPIGLTSFRWHNVERYYWISCYQES